MKKYLCILSLIVSSHLFGQTGIGTTTPNASAKLDVYATNKGFLPPRVTLTSATDASTISSPAEGLLVYNLGSVGLQAGYYYWNGASWATIATASSAGNGVTSSDMVKLYGEVYSNALGKIAHANGYSFTVPVSGRYLFDFSSSGYLNQASMTLTFKVRQGTTDLASEFFTNANNNVHVVFDGKVEVNLQAGVTYNVQVTTTGLRDGGDYDRVYYKQIAGNLPVTGQTVDYVSTSLNANITGVGSNTDIKLQQLNGGNIPYNATTGVYTLSANKTYILQAQLRVSTASTAGAYLSYTWVDAISNAELVSNSEALNSSNSSGATFGSKDIVQVIYTPTTNQTIKLRSLTSVGTQTIWLGTASIVQIGSSAIINPWILSGTNTYNTIGNVGIGTNAPTVPLDVNGTVNASNLNLSNVTTAPSVNLKNGDAAATYSDNAQIKMGWAGSAAGTSQYAQFVHTRHNAGPTGNAIDFYLSNGTANNTINSGSTKAMSISSPGNIEIPGKITFGDASGNVTLKVSAWIDAGAYVTLDNIKVTVPTSGSRGLSVATVSGTLNMYYEGTYMNGVTYNYGSRTATTGTFTTADSGSLFGWNFTSAGDRVIYHLTDAENGRVYRITLIIQPSYIKNFICIERLI